MKPLNLLKSVAVGTALTSVAFFAQAASAITLTPVTESFAFDPANGWTIDATAQGRAGVLGTGDWELGGFDDAIPNGVTPTSQAQWVWGDNESVSWLLNVDQTTGLASFKMWTATQSRTVNLGASDGFNGFGIVTSSQSATKSNGSYWVAPDTTMSLTVNQINGQNINPFTTSATSLDPIGKDIGLNYFALSENSYSLSGTLFMDWLSVNPQATSARSRVQFEVKIFDRPSQSVPEPGVTLGLLLLGGLGVASRLSQKAQNKN
jgi:hypothetical protein